VLGRVPTANLGPDFAAVVLRVEERDQINSALAGQEMTPMPVTTTRFLEETVSIIGSGLEMKKRPTCQH
jgi:hypothetical protein